MMGSGSLTARGRRLCGATLLAALAFGGVPGSRVAAAATATIAVTLDKATVMRMPDHAETIVVGNPMIADVTSLKNNSLVVVTGKAFGETNLIFLDRGGQPIEEADVRVGLSPGLLTVQRGVARESYSCQPRCQPTVTLGDSKDFLGDATTQIQQRNTLATPVSH